MFNVNSIQLYCLENRKIVKKIVRFQSISRKKTQTKNLTLNKIIFIYISKFYYSKIKKTGNVTLWSDVLLQVFINLAVHFRGRENSLWKLWFSSQLYSTLSLSLFTVKTLILISIALYTFLIFFWQFDFRFHNNFTLIMKWQ